MGRREHRLLELRGILPGAEAADGSELLVWTHWGRRGGVQHSTSGPDQGQRIYRVAGQARNAAQPVSDSTSRAAWRGGGAEHCRPKPEPGRVITPSRTAAPDNWPCWS